MKHRDKENIEFGKRLKKLREAANLTVESLSSNLEVAASTYREWENGRAISGHPYVKMANVLGVSLEALFGIERPNRGEILLRLDAIRNLMNEIKIMV